MYSRVTLLEVDTVRIGLDEATEIFRAKVLPTLSALEGYDGLILLTTPEGKGMIVSLWQTEAAAERAAAVGTVALAEYVALFAAPPGRECYEVALTDIPGIRVE